MALNLPKTAQEFLSLTWQQIEPIALELTGRPLSAANLESWLMDWSDLQRLVEESHQRLYVAITTHTEDESARQRYNTFVDTIQPQAQSLFNKLKRRLLESGLKPAGLDVFLRNIGAEEAIFREANLPLLARELKIVAEYDEIVGRQTVVWDGEEKTLAQLSPVYMERDRSRREHAWRLAAQRQLADRGALNDLWGRLLSLRGEIAANAGMDSFRVYTWQKMLRFDYSPDDCLAFHQAIEEEVVPAATRAYGLRLQRLSVDRLRPWDLSVDPFGRGPLRPFHQAAELEAKTEVILRQVEPQLADYYAAMRREGLLDLENRKGKAPGGYCTNFDAVRRPFIFMNAVGIHDDVITLLHECGHAFHVFETTHLPYYGQLPYGLEFLEVASTSMEFLAAPYLTLERGGFYTPQEVARVRVEHLTDTLLFWPYMAVVDAFQHWVYENPGKAAQPEECGPQWAALYRRYLPGVDWSGLDAELEARWQCQLHIFSSPFYYVEYGLAALGAIQVWRNFLQDQAAAVQAYRQALALGGTASIPDLYQAAGAKFAFDPQTLRSAVELIEKTVRELEAQ